jgi:protein SCO1/2
VSAVVRAEMPESQSYNKVIKITESIGVDKKLGDSIPGSLKFKDEQGKDVTLSEFYGKVPILLGLVYYECPNLCTLVINGAFRTLQQLQLKRGKDFQVVLVSIDPKEKPELAAAKKRKYSKTYFNDVQGEGLHFLTGDQESITALAKSVGFRYTYDAATKQYAHPGTIMFLTPEGKLSQYLFGVEYAEKDVRLALVEASGNKIGTWKEHFLLLCYRYDPTLGTYGVAIMRILRIVSVLTVGFIVGMVIFLSRRKRPITTVSMGME